MKNDTRAKMVGSLIEIFHYVPAYLGFSLGDD